MGLFYYLNDDHSVRPCTRDEWMNQFEDMHSKGSQHVAFDKVLGHHVSTVFLGNNHSFFGGKPLVFETMIFKGDSGIDEYCARYATWDEAVYGHIQAIEWVKLKKEQK